jgi:hypothetical protein
MAPVRGFSVLNAGRYPFQRACASGGGWLSLAGQQNDQTPEVAAAKVHDVALE